MVTRCECTFISDLEGGWDIILQLIPKYWEEKKKKNLFNLSKLYYKIPLIQARVQKFSKISRDISLGKRKATSFPIFITKTLAAQFISRESKTQQSLNFLKKYCIKHFFCIF